ncbi:PstS family phosphate ABC transporter substrate-binding protein [Dysgonomonas sp. 25]|uniref:PstS family phosphate ABC transporter substrate-binding protein n=1 Tax=Dysgonomonas sp. 25 TaxID=2302933 RepID=UPI0013D5B81E|nr:substrate-binding domain-containing protein [Dysgonomonas sp. 25]NDV67608.1 hypothetical protein [Dysgonomonas sp. 25]
MQSRLARVVFSFMLLIMLGVIGFFFIVVAAMSVDGDFYIYLTLIAYFLLLVWFILWSFKLLKRRILLYSMLGIISLSVISVVCKNMHTSYINNIPVVDEQSLYLSEYEPFMNNTKAVYLPSESTLKLADNLPRMNGATALYPLYAAFVQATYPERGNYTLHGDIIKGNTTPKAYEELINGEADIIFCAAPSRKQVEEAKAQGVEFKLTPVGREAFVFFVNKDNPIDNIIVEQIQQIYSGGITNWRDVGGKNQEIKAYQRPEGSGSQTMLEKIMCDTPLMQPLQNDRVGGMGAIIERTASYKNYDNAIGYSFLFFVTGMVKNDDIKLLKVNGTEATRETIASNEYPFAGDFYAITTNKLANPNADKLIDWILSEQGQYLVAETGYVPIKEYER